MKKLLFSAAALTLLFASCQKQDNKPAATSNLPQAKKMMGSIYYQTSDGPMRTYYDNGGNGPNDYGCNSNVGDCAPEDIVIKAPKIYDMVQTLDRGGEHALLYAEIMIS